MITLFHQRSPRRRPALVFLLVLLTSFSWVRATAVYLVAQADSTHTAGVSLRDGGLAVVLSHGGEDGGLANVNGTHRHGATAQLLTLLSSAPSTTADHVVSVGGGSDYTMLEGSQLGGLHNNLPVVVALAHGAETFPACDRRVSTHQPRPPPVLNAHLEAVRVTRLRV